MMAKFIKFTIVQSQAPIHPLYHPHLQTDSETKLDLAPSSSFSGTCMLLLPPRTNTVETRALIKMITTRSIPFPSLYGFEAELESIDTWRTES